MPIEIRELVIRATVTEDPVERDDHSFDGGDGRFDDEPGQARAEIIETCVAEVMRILRTRDDR